MHFVEAEVLLEEISMVLEISPSTVQCYNSEALTLISINMKTSNLRFGFILNCAPLAAVVTPWCWVFSSKLILTQQVTLEAFPLPAVIFRCS